MWRTVLFHFHLRWRELVYLWTPVLSHIISSPSSKPGLTNLETGANKALLERTGTVSERLSNGSNTF